MGKLIYSAITSSDGYVEDENGGFDWAAPDEEVSPSSTTSSDRLGSISTAAGCTKRWPDGRPMSSSGTDSPPWSDFAEIWRAAEKVVFSTNLGEGIQRKNQDRGDLRPRR